jgi:hypothetical protein
MPQKRDLVQSTVTASIILFEGFKEALVIFQVGILAPKIVDQQGEHEFAVVVFP